MASPCCLGRRAMETAVSTRTYKRHRIIQEQRGTKTVERVVQEDVELPPYLPHLASAMKDMAAMAVSAGEGERMWARPIRPRGPTSARRAGTD